MAFLGWRWWNTNHPGEDTSTEIVFNDVATRGGTLTSSLRSEPRTFNRIVDRSVPVDLYSILTGSKLVFVNRATQEVEPGLAEKLYQHLDRHLISEDVTLTDRTGTQRDLTDVRDTVRAFARDEVAPVAARDVDDEDLHYSMITRTSPVPTESPAATRISLIVPDVSALIWFSIFIASSTTTA
mgnify:CR=1 FL=1